MNQALEQREFPPIDRERLIERLGTILPAASLLHATEDLRPYECDGLSAYRNLPLVVALPDSVEQVQAILRLSCRIFPRIPLLSSSPFRRRWPVGTPWSGSWGGGGWGSSSWPGRWRWTGWWP